MWQSLILDAHAMAYPPSSVCTAGTEEVQRYLCSGESQEALGSPIYEITNLIKMKAILYKGFC